MNSDPAHPSSLPTTPSGDGHLAGANPVAPETTIEEVPKESHPPIKSFGETPTIPPTDDDIQKQR